MFSRAMLKELEREREEPQNPATSYTVHKYQQKTVKFV